MHRLDMRTVYVVLAAFALGLGFHHLKPRPAEATPLYTAGVIADYAKGQVARSPGAGGGTFGASFSASSVTGAFVASGTNPVVLSGSALGNTLTSNANGWQSNTDFYGSCATCQFRSAATSGNYWASAATSGARIDFGAGASDYASSDGTTVTFAGALSASSLGSAGTNTLSGATPLNLTGSSPSVFFNTATLATIESGASDANTSATVPAISLKCDTNITDGDLCVGQRDSTGTVNFGVTEQGTVISNSALTKGTITLAAGTGTATVTSGAKCVCSSTTANPAYCSVVTTTLTATGTGTDAVSYICL